MPRAGGVYTLPPGYFATSGQNIQVSQHNPPLEDIAQALTGSLPRDGSAPMQANLPMGGNRVTNIAAATSASDAVRLDQVMVAGGWLDSVSALAMAANEIPYATGALSAAKTALTAFGRALIGGADAAAARTVLALGDLATMDVSDLGSLATLTPTGTADNTTFLRGDGGWVGVIGFGQTWQAFNASTRVAGVTYQNTTGRAIHVRGQFDSATSRVFQVSVNGSSWISLDESGGGTRIPFGAVIPNGHYYRVDGAAMTWGFWAELR